MHILQDIVIILVSAIIIIIICSKLNIPSVVGFLLTGMIIGPYAIGLIQNTEDIETFAEVGVVLMMFIIGIEFSIKKLHRIKKIILVGGGGQVIITTAIVVGAASLYGYEINSAVFFGFLVSLSSTAIVLKLLQDRRQLDSPQGKIELGILLFQDLSVVPMVVLTPILGLKGGGDIAGSLIKIGTAFLAINAIFFSARFLMPHILNTIVKTRLKEIFILASLLACLGMAFLTNYLGLSFALGAFIAGLIISNRNTATRWLQIFYHSKKASTACSLYQLACCLISITSCKIFPSSFPWVPEYSSSKGSWYFCLFSS
jgi:CPA2 family monovalent cation:H+ antiporter-2